MKVTANARPFSDDYPGAASVCVNNKTDKTIGFADDPIYEILDVTADCSKYQTFIDNVKNLAGVVQNNSFISVIGRPLSEAGLKDLGLFVELG